MIAAVLLAAGGGTRFGGDRHKLLAPLGDRPVYRHALDHAREAAIGPCIVVVGAVELELPPDVHVVRNPRWAEGQAGSLALGIAAADALGADAVVVGLADQPFVPAEAWRAVATADPDAPIAVAVYAAGRGPNPVRLQRIVWPLLPSEGDEGARSVIREHPGWVCDVQCVGSASDIDTVEDLAKWTSS